MDIFEFTDYKQFITKKISQMPKRGHGIYRKLSVHLGLNSVVISQIFKGSRELTPEQALATATYFEFTQLETDYFFTMVQLSRAGDYKLKNYLTKQLEDLRKKSQSIKERVQVSNELSTEIKSIYYSNWSYVGVKLAGGLVGGRTAGQISNSLGLPLSETMIILEFLIHHALLKKHSDLYTSGIGSTHLESSSPLALSHHKNWRVKAMEHMSTGASTNLFASFPCTLSKKDFQKFRDLILKFIENFDKIVEPSHAESLACFNIDWFEFSKKE